MKQIYVIKCQDSEFGRYYTKEEAQEAILAEIEHSDLTVLDFSWELVEINEDVNELIPDYEAAKQYLRVVHDTTFKICSVMTKHANALVALNALFIIAEAWNKADDFEPDYGKFLQNRWFPWFKYDKEQAGFVFALAKTSTSYTGAPFGSRLCFKSSKRARQFGEQFIDLWNDVLLFRLSDYKPAPENPSPEYPGLFGPEDF